MWVCLVIQRNDAQLEFASDFNEGDSTKANMGEIRNSRIIIYF